MKLLIKYLTKIFYKLTHWFSKKKVYSKYAYPELKIALPKLPIKASSDQFYTALLYKLISHCGQMYKVTKKVLSVLWKEKRKCFIYCLAYI